MRPSTYPISSTHPRSFRTRHTVSDGSRRCFRSGSGGASEIFTVGPSDFAPACLAPTTSCRTSYLSRFPLLATCRVQQFTRRHLSSDPARQVWILHRCDCRRRYRRCDRARLCCRMPDRFPVVSKKAKGETRFGSQRRGAFRRSWMAMTTTSGRVTRPSRTARRFS